MCISHAQYMTTDMHLYILYSDMLQGRTDIIIDCTVFVDCKDHSTEITGICSILYYWCILYWDA